MTDPTPEPLTVDRRSRRTWPLGAVAVVAVLAAGLGGYFGFRAVSHGGAASGGALPAARAGAAMAYDAANNTMVMFGGRGAGGNVLGDTWTFDGANWTQQHPAAAPSGRSDALMAYDPQSRQIVLFGGQTGVGGAAGSAGPAIAPMVPSSFAPETWVWDGVNWRQATGAQPPLLPPLGRMATDPATRSIVLVSGAAAVVRPQSVCPLRAPPDGPLPPGNGCSGGPPIALASETWVWRGTAWENTKSGAPGSGTGGFIGDASLLTPDPQTGRLAYVSSSMLMTCPLPLGVSSGSYACPTLSNGASSSTSEWDGSAWTAATSAPGPWLAVGGGMVAPDPATHSAVYYGADGATWVWTSQWTRLQPPSHPPAQLFGATSAYDDALGRVLMFGGEVASPNALELSNQLWSWDGSTWSLVSGGMVAEPTPSGGVVPPVLPQSPVPTGVPGRCGFSPGAHPGVGPAQPICPLPTLPA